MTWVAVAVIGGGIIGGAISAHGAESAAQTQANAANNAAGTQLQMFNTVNNQQAPFRAAGNTSLAAIMQGFGLPPPTDGSGNPIAAGPGAPDAGFFTHQFDANDLNANLAPNYDFMLKQGQGAVKAEANVTGGLGANSLAALDQYTTGFAQNAYQQAYANYTANQTNIYNRLASIAGLGQTAGSNQTTGASTFGGNIANAQIGAGNALAAGTVGAANAYSGAIGNIGQYYMLQSIMNNPNFAGSEPAIKQDIVALSILPNGLTLYSFRYKPKYRDEWGHGRRVGVMADEVEILMPDAVRMHRDGYRVVDYGRIGHAG